MHPAVINLSENGSRFSIWHSSSGNPSNMVPTIPFHIQCGAFQCELFKKSVQCLQWHIAKPVDLPFYILVCNAFVFDARCPRNWFNALVLRKTRLIVRNAEMRGSTAQRNSPTCFYFRNHALSSVRVYTWTFISPECVSS